MTPTNNNYFDLPNYQQLLCSVNLFKIRHGGIDINVHTEGGDALYRLYFVSPSYMQLPTQWKGAGFRIGTLEEHLTMWKLLATQKSTQQSFLETNRLFIVENDSISFPTKVRILAVSARLIQLKAATKRDTNESL